MYWKFNCVYDLCLFLKGIGVIGLIVLIVIIGIIILMDIIKLF